MMRTPAPNESAEQMSRPWSGATAAPSSRRPLFQQMTDGSYVGFIDGAAHVRALTEPGPWWWRLQNWFRTKILRRPLASGEIKTVERFRFVGDRRDDRAPFNGPWMEG